jgi:hypothetical protein
MFSAVSSSLPVIFTLMSQMYLLVLCFISFLLYSLELLQYLIPVKSVTVDAIIIIIYNRTRSTKTVTTSTKIVQPIMCSYIMAVVLFQLTAEHYIW